MELAEKSKASDWTNVAEKVQHQVLNEFHQNSISLHDLRLAALRHPEVAFWVKHNRARRGDLREGDAAPNVHLLRAQDDEPTSLLEEISTDDYTVVVAGSLS
jgi:hypothetical protein